MDKKTLHKAKILEYLSDPENDFATRAFLSVTVCGYKQPRSLYRHFTTKELTDIEADALKERKIRSARQRSRIYGALYSRAIGCSHIETIIKVIGEKIIKTDIVKHYPPETAACREWLDRVEGKVPDSKSEDVTDQTAQPVEVIIKVEDASNKG